MRRRAFLRGVAVAAAAAAGGAVVGTETAEADASGPANHLAAAVNAYGTQPRAVHVHWYVDTTRRAIALTFDDGPDPRWTPRVLDLLGEHGARATFFALGSAALRHPDLVRAAAARGEVGNHSFSHPDLSRLPVRAVEREVDRTHDVLTSILGTAPTLFRPPYGNLSGPVLGAAAAYGYTVALWTDHLRGDATVAADVARIVAVARPGRVLLGHDGRKDRSGDLARLPGALRGLKAEGYALVSWTDLVSAR